MVKVELWNSFCICEAGTNNNNGFEIREKKMQKC